MTVNRQSAVVLLESVLQAEATRTEMGVTVLKKAQDAAKQQGEAMIQVIENSVPATRPRENGLDVYA